MKNTILKGITALAAIIALLGLGVDRCEPWVLVVIAVSYVWLALFTYANKDRLERRSYGKD